MYQPLPLDSFGWWPSASGRGVQAAGKWWGEMGTPLERARDTAALVCTGPLYLSSHNFCIFKFVLKSAFVYLAAQVLVEAGRIASSGM